MAKLRIPTIGKGKVKNSNVWKKKKIYNSIVLKKAKFRNPMFGKRKI